MSTKRKASKKAKVKAGTKLLVAGDPIIINGGGGLIKAGDKRVTVEFDHNGFGPDDGDPTLWVNEDCKLNHIDADEIGVPTLDTPLAPTDKVTIRCAKGAQNSDIQIQAVAGPPSGLGMTFKRSDYPYRKRKHAGKDFQVIKILINGQLSFQSNGGDCHIRVGTTK